MKKSLLILLNRLTQKYRTMVVEYDPIPKPVPLVQKSNSKSRKNIKKPDKNIGAKSGHHNIGAKCGPHVSGTKSFDGGPGPCTQVVESFNKKRVGAKGKQKNVKGAISVTIDDVIAKMVTGQDSEIIKHTERMLNGDHANKVALAKKNRKRREDTPRMEFSRFICENSQPEAAQLTNRDANVEVVAETPPPDNSQLENERIANLANPKPPKARSTNRARKTLGQAVKELDQPKAKKNKGDGNDEIEPNQSNLAQIPLKIVDQTVNPGNGDYLTVGFRENEVHVHSKLHKFKSHKVEADGDKLTITIDFMK